MPFPGWQRIVVPFTTPAGTTDINVYPLRDSGGTTVDILLWGASLQLASGGPELLTYNNSVGNGDRYNTNNCNVFLNYGIDPVGGGQASRITVNSAGHIISYAGVTVTASTNYVFAFWARNNGGTLASYSVYDNTHVADIVAPTSYFSQLPAEQYLLYGDASPNGGGGDATAGTYLHLGLVFRSTVNGLITGIRYNQPPGGSGGVYTASLWDQTPTLLASKAAAGNSGGWLQILFDKPVAITAGTLYKAVIGQAKSTGLFWYYSNPGYFLAQRAEGQLVAVANSEATNCTFDYDAAVPPQYPVSAGSSSLYWISPLFLPT